MHGFMDCHMRQTAMGQQLAVELAIKETPGGCKIKQDVFGVLCGSCGFWCLVQEHVLPSLGLGDQRIDALYKDFKEPNSS